MRAAKCGRFPPFPDAAGHVLRQAQKNYLAAVVLHPPIVARRPPAPQAGDHRASDVARECRKQSKTPVLMALLQQALKPPVFTERGFGINQQAHRPSANWAKLRLRLLRSNCGVDQASGVCAAAVLSMSCELSFHLL